jgi:SAM-dependent methyltransferase
VESVLAALEQQGLTGPLTLDDIALVAEFHTAGRAATLTLADAAGLKEEMRVLDVGAGPGGPALVLASLYGCRVTAYDLTPEFCELAQILASRTGLAERVTVVQGDALALPFADASFDAAWSQHAQMNIADKPSLYRGIRRVLVGGGTLALWDIVAGDGGPVHVPVPWASEPSQSHLAGFDELRETVRAAGFEERFAEDGTEEALAFMALMRERTKDGMPPVGMQLIVANIEEKMRNFTRNLEEGRVRLIRGVYTAV